MSIYIEPSRTGAAGTEYQCPLCKQWVWSGQWHECSIPGQYHADWSFTMPDTRLDRIIELLERIARALEAR